MKRILATGGLCLTLLFSSTLPSAALTPTYTIAGAYKSSTYHQNLLAVTKTGDPAFDTVAAAMSQLGYHEGNSTADYHGKNSAGTKNYTEYNRALGTVGSTYSYAWCAAFVSWCLNVAGAGNSAGGSFASCSLWVERLQELGLYSTRASGYTPKPGDLIFFRSSGVSRASNHVGIVRYTKNGKVYTVEGNSSHKVSLQSYALTDTYIVGYGKPQYGGISLGQTALSLEDVATGLYTVTNDFVNVRATPAATATKLGTLYCGALVEVTEIKNGWGKISYQGKTAYISLDYADFTTPVFYTVTYLSDEGQESYKQDSYFSFRTATVNDATPQKEGYSFVKWQSQDGIDYTAGDPLPQQNITLTAVWEALPTQEDTNVSSPSQNEELPPFDAAPDQAGESDIADLPEGTLSSPSANVAAARSAGVISGLFAAVCGLYWYVKRFLIL